MVFKNSLLKDCICKCFFTDLRTYPLFNLVKLFPLNCMIEMAENGGARVPRMKLRPTLKTLMTPMVHKLTSKTTIFKVILFGNYPWYNCNVSLLWKCKKWFLIRRKLFAFNFNTSTYHVVYIILLRTTFVSNNYSIIF